MGVMSGEHLFEILRNDFRAIEDSRELGKINISLVDCLMSGFAVFALKYESLLQFEDERRLVEAVSNYRSNLKSLFNIQVIPSDTQMRAILDDVDPQSVRRSFKSLFELLQRRKYLRAFEFVSRERRPIYLMPVDGTGYFCSNSVHCANCLTRTDKTTGEVTYQHQMLAAAVVHPDLATVIPLAPEPIIQQDGSEKNDCEFHAFNRFIRHFREDHPQLNVIVTTDALFSLGPVVELLEENRMNFIMAVKPESHKALFREMAGAENLDLVRHHMWTEEIGEKVKKMVTHRYRYKENVALNNAYALKQGINFLEYWETTEWQGKRGPEKEEKHFSWVTDLKVRKESDFEKLARGGRARWKIENETFNTLKNQGYHFEHNYGHGYKNLSVNFAYLMMLSFLVDQIQQMGCKRFQSLLEIIRRNSLWQSIRHLYKIFYFQSWADLLDAAYQFSSGQKQRIVWNSS